MKRNLLIIATLLILLSAFNFNEKNKEKKPLSESVKAASPLEGNWELVVNEINGKKVNAHKTQQFKVFHEGYFSFIMYDDAGKFYLAGAGPYELNGDTYSETHTYSSNPKYVGAKDWQKWEMKGDTLIFYGFEKVILADGSDITKEMGGSHFVEKRVRVKNNNSSALLK